MHSMIGRNAEKVIVGILYIIYYISVCRRLYIMQQAGELRLSLPAFWHSITMPCLMSHESRVTTFRPSFLPSLRPACLLAFSPPFALCHAIVLGIECREQVTTLYQAFCHLLVGCSALTNWFNLHQLFPMVDQPARSRPPYV